MHIFADRQADAYQGMIGALTYKPRIKTIGDDTGLILGYLRALQAWNDELTAAQIPLYTYADPVISVRTEAFIGALHDRTIELADEASTTFQKHINDTGNAPDKLRSHMDQLDKLSSKYTALITSDANGVLAILRAAVQATPRKFDYDSGSHA